jgi:hypothetical protein
MGAGSGQVASDWFDAMYEDVAATGARFTAVGVVTPDPASVESVLAWANRLQDRAQYLIVQNATSPQADFSYWDSAEQAIRFREALSPIVIRSLGRTGEPSPATRCPPWAGRHKAECSQRTKACLDRDACRELAMRRGRKIAKIAMARKLAVRLYWMWRKEWDYEQLKKFGSHAGEPVYRLGVQENTE